MWKEIYICDQCGKEMERQDHQSHPWRFCVYDSQLVDHNGHHLCSANCLNLWSVKLLNEEKEE